MNKFENALLKNENRKKLENALINWVLGNDGEDGAIGKVLDMIPWTDEMENVISWEKYAGKIDDAIGSRCGWKDKAHLILKDENQRELFLSQIENKVNEIIRVYNEMINDLNGKSMLFRGVVERCVGVDQMGFCKYEIIGRFYGDTKYDVVLEIWNRYGCFSWKDFNRFCDAMYTGNNVDLGMKDGYNIHCHLGDKVTNS